MSVRLVFTLQSNNSILRLTMDNNGIWKFRVFLNYEGYVDVNLIRLVVNRRYSV